MTNPDKQPSQGFVITKGYRRFAEMCDACRRARAVGLGYGPPGTGKTESASYYAQWNLIEPYLPESLITFTGRSTVDSLYPYRPLAFTSSPLDATIQQCRTVFYTPPITGAPGRIEKEVLTLFAAFSYLVEAAHQRQQGEREFLVTPRYTRLIELLVVDEANRLKDGGLEQVYVIYNLKRSGRLLNNLHYVYSELVSAVLFQRSRARLYIIRDIADRGKLGLVLLGMPGLEKRIARAPQLYSRLGFNHEMEPLSDDETRFFLDQRWRHRVSVHSNDFTDQEAAATILRITRGNIRLIERLMMQVEHVLVANQITVVTKEVVETARKNLIIGPD